MRRQAGDAVGLSVNSTEAVIAREEADNPVCAPGMGIDLEVKVLP